MPTSIPRILDHCVASSRSEILELSKHLAKKDKVSADNIFEKMRRSPDVMHLAKLISTSAAEKAAFKQKLSEKASLGGAVGGLAIMVGGALALSNVAEAALAFEALPLIMAFACIAVMILAASVIAKNLLTYDSELLYFIKLKMNEIK